MYGVVIPDIWNKDETNIFDNLENLSTSDNANKSNSGKEAYILAKDSSAISVSQNGDASTTITHENGIEKNGGKKFYTNNKYQKVLADFDGYKDQCVGYTNFYDE